MIQITQTCRRNCNRDTKMCYKIIPLSLFYFLTLSSIVICGPVTDTQNQEFTDSPLVNEEQIPSATDCYSICGCDRAYVYNETTNECDLNMDYIIKSILMQSNQERSENKYEDHDMVNDDGMAKRLRLEAQIVFKGIIISLIIFLTCACLCTVSACVYCCHINYSDRKLKSDMRALAKKLKRKYDSTKRVRRTPLEPIEESCNVVVGNAGLYVV